MKHPWPAPDRGSIDPCRSKATRVKADDDKLGDKNIKNTLLKKGITVKEELKGKHIICTEPCLFWESKPSEEKILHSEIPTFEDVYNLSLGHPKLV